MVRALHIGNQFHGMSQLDISIIHICATYLELLMRQPIAFFLLTIYDV